jgi:hypothetical protein
MEKVKAFFMSPEGIGFVKAILDSYEDIGILSVRDGKRGIVEITYSSFFEHDLERILRDMTGYGITVEEVEGA